VKIGIRRPSLKKRIAARTSVKRAIRHRAGLKAPRGWGWLTNPRRAAYNRIYSRTTRPLGCHHLLLVLPIVFTAALFLLAAGTGNKRLSSRRQR
jgi:hypothetical protein